MSQETLASLVKNDLLTLTFSVQVTSDHQTVEEQLELDSIVAFLHFIEGGFCSVEDEVIRLARAVVLLPCCLNTTTTYMNIGFSILAEAFRKLSKDSHGITDRNGMRSFYDITSL